MQPEKPFIRELAASFDPMNMSHKESMDLANALMKAGEGDAKMNAKFNMFDLLQARIDFNKSMNMPTNLLEDSYSFLEKIQVARNTPSINEYT